MRSRWRGPSERIGTHDQFAGTGAPTGSGSRGRDDEGIWGPLKLLMRQSPVSGLTPVYANRLESLLHATNRNTTPCGASVIVKGFPEICSQGKDAMATEVAARTKRESANPKKRSRAS